MNSFSLSNKILLAACQDFYTRRMISTSNIVQLNLPSGGLGLVKDDTGCASRHHSRPPSNDFFFYLDLRKVTGYTRGDPCLLFFP